MMAIVKTLILSIFTCLIVNSTEAQASGKRTVYVAGADPQVEIYSLDLDTGALTRVGTGSTRAWEKPAGSPYVAWGPGQRFLYALDRMEPPAIAALSIEPETGALKLLNRMQVGPGSPPHLSVHTSGRWLFVVHYSQVVGGHSSILPIASDGSLGTPRPGPEPGRKTHMILPDPTGRYVFVPCTNSHYIAQYVFDAAAGVLTPNDPPLAPTPKGAGPRHMAFHPTVRMVYVINETASSLSSYTYDPAKGTLSNPETLDTLPSTFDRSQNSTAHVLVEPSGKFVYGSNRGHDSIVIFSVDPVTGRLNRIGWEQAGGRIKTPRNFAADPDGKFLLVANQASDSVIVFRIGRDGRLEVQGDPISTGSKPTFIGVLQPFR